MFLHYGIKRYHPYALLFILNSVKLLITNNTLIFAGFILTRAVVSLLTYLFTKLKHALSRMGAICEVNIPAYIIYGLTGPTVVIEVIKTSASVCGGLLISLIVI